jgi:malate permease and related proteins
MSLSDDIDCRRGSNRETVFLSVLICSFSYPLLDFGPTVSFQTGLSIEALVYHLSNVLVPILLCVLAGFGLAKFKVYFDTKMVGSLVSNIGYPSLILSHLASQHVAFSTFLYVMLAAVVMIACFGLISFLFLKITGLPTKAFMSPMMLNNVGNIGLPVSFLAFGDQGMAVAMAILVIVVIGIFSLGIWFPAGKLSFVDILKQPVIYAVLLALVLMGTQTALPEPIAKGMSILGGLAIPLMLLTLGYTLATLNIGGVLKGCLLSVVHLLMSVGIAYGVSLLFGFEGVTKGVFVLMCLMPASVATYLWVEKYQPDHAADVAAFIMFSTLLTILVVPLALTVWI